MCPWQSWYLIDTNCYHGPCHSGQRFLAWEDALPKPSTWTTQRGYHPNCPTLLSTTVSDANSGERSATRVGWQSWQCLAAVSREVLLDPTQWLKSDQKEESAWWYGLFLWLFREGERVEHSHGSVASRSHVLCKKNKWESNGEQAVSVHAKSQPVWERIWEDQRHQMFTTSIKRMYVHAYYFIVHIINTKLGRSQ